MLVECQRAEFSRWNGVLSEKQPPDALCYKMHGGKVICLKGISRYFGKLVCFVCIVVVFHICEINIKSAHKVNVRFIHTKLQI